MPHIRTQTPHANPASVPSINIIRATPSTHAASSEGSCFEFNTSLENAWADIAAAPFPTSAPLAPRTQAEETSTRKKLVPKKSKLGLLSGLGAGRDRERARDFSDVVRRVGADCSARGAFEIYVDPDVGDGYGTGEVVVVKKAKSRAALDGMSWGAKEVTNVPKAPKEGKDKNLLKVKAEEGQKWWSIGRGRKDSKEEKSKENKISHKPIEYIHDPQPRSKTPELFRQAQSDTRARFNSLDAVGLLKSSSRPVATRPVKFDEPSPTSTPGASRAATPTPTLARSITPTLTRSVTPTSGGLLAPPGANQAQGQGSIAVRAMRSVRSLARIGSWAQLKNMPAPDGEEAQTGSATEKERKGTIKEKKRAKKDKENAGVNASEDVSAKDEKKKKKKSLKAKKDKAVEKAEKQATIRMSSSSFEVGALTSSPGPAPRTLGQAYLAAPDAHTLGTKKRSILGLGLPSSMRLPSLSSGAAGGTARNASTASSTISVAGIATAAIGAPQRLSAGSFSSTSTGGAGRQYQQQQQQVIIAGAQGQTRRGSMVSTLSAASGLSACSGGSGGSSLRPISVSSSLSVGSSGPGGRAASVRSGSVRWDEEGLETVRERRGAERAARKEEEKKREDAERKVQDVSEKRGKSEKDEKRTSRESKHSLEGRRRTSVKTVFPELMFNPEETVAAERNAATQKKQAEEKTPCYPILTIEEATADGHAFVDEALSESGSADVHWPSTHGDEQAAVSATPVKKARARPLSEQMLGKSRPKPMYEDEEGVLSILSAATNDLASLINNLDLQATPSTPGDMTPLRAADLSPGDFTPMAFNIAGQTAATATGQSQGQSQTQSQSHKKARAAQMESPLKSAKKVTMMSSVSSLRPYAQSRGYVHKPPAAPVTLGAGLLPAVTIVSGSVGRSAGVKAKVGTTGKLNLNGTGSNGNTNASIIGQQIAPWSKLMEGLSPVKEKVKAFNAKASVSPPHSHSRAHPTGTLSASVSSMASSTSTFRPGHKRTMTPAMEPEPEPVFQPLRPARSRLMFPPAPISAPAPAAPEPNNDDMLFDDLAPGSRHSTFGRSSGALTPVFKRIQEDELARERRRSRGSYLAPSDAGSRLSTGSFYQGGRLSTGSYLSVQSGRSGGSVESRGSAGSRTYDAPGRAGTLGADDASFFEEGMDPDSDVPDELRDILAHSDTEETRSSYGEFGFEARAADSAAYHYNHSNAMDVDVGNSDITSRDPPSPPPSMPLPTIHATLAASPARSDTTGTDGEDRTQASFDWTGTLNDLNESGASDRRSFVEQLEHAFKTPAKVDLRYDFGVSSLRVPAGAVPPVPCLPLAMMGVAGAGTSAGGRPVIREVEAAAAAAVAVDWRMAVEADLSTSSMDEDNVDEEEREVYEYDSGELSGVVGRDESSGMEMDWENGERIADEGMSSIFAATETEDSQDRSTFDFLARGEEERIQDVKELTMAQGSSGEYTENSLLGESTSSRPLDGELDTSFRFGGLPASLRKVTKTADKNRPMTLSDIIPPPEHARRLSQSFEASGIKNSDLFTEAYQQLQPQIKRVVVEPRAATARRPTARIIADKEAKHRSIYKAPSRPTSGISFTGLNDSFEEARRRYEFAPERPAFYPPPAARPTTLQVRHNRGESAMSAWSVSSFGSVQHAGSSDPFGFTDVPPVPPLPSLRGSLRERPGADSANLSSVEEQSESMGVIEMSTLNDQTYAEDTSGEDQLNNTSEFFLDRRGYHHARRPNSFSMADFEFDVPALYTRPMSENMSLSVMMSEFEDTFDFRQDEEEDARQAPGSLRPRPRLRSDASNFSFHAPIPGGRGHHRRRESNMSVSSFAPPISLYNRSFPHHGHRRNDSVVSVSSVSYSHSRTHSRSHSYVRQSVNGGHAAYTRHRRDMSDASMSTEFSAGYSYIGRPGVGDKMFGERFDRPGVGDKMFETGGIDLGPLTSITASPPESAVRASFASADSGHGSEMWSEEVPLDSLGFDESTRGFDFSCSVVERTRDEASRESVGSDDVFADDSDDRYLPDAAGNRPPPLLLQRHLLAMNTADNTANFGADITDVVSPGKLGDEDTMLSMLGGGHAPIRRQSILESPSTRVEKRKFATIQSLRLFKGKATEQYESPAKARIVEKPSLASASSFQFGSDRMIKARRGLLQRQSLEDSCLIADGEELNNIYFSPVFTRPGPTTRSRSSTCTTSSSGSFSGADTPPLSSSTGGETPPLMHQSDASSLSGGSQSSIDLTQIDIALTNATSPMSGILGHARVRARARGAGHRRRYSQHMSRSSVYETIDEDAELTGVSMGTNVSARGASPALSAASKKSSPTTRQAVFVVDSDTASFDGHSQPEEATWNDERGIVALRKFYALRDEAQTTVSESRKVWTDTPFSLHALQYFEAPAEPAGMQALLEYSVQNFGPLPSELRPHRVRSRTSSRASPYPQARVSKATMSPEKTRSAKTTMSMSPETKRRGSKKSLALAETECTPVILQQRSMNRNKNGNGNVKISGAPSLEALKPFSPLGMMDIAPTRENAFGLAPNARPRVPSNARRTALGWAKRSTGKTSTSAEQKENLGMAGTISTPGDNLRLNRPRPRGRPTPGGRTPAAQNRAIRL